jgi:hypothetical protein
LTPGRVFYILIASGGLHRGSCLFIMLPANPLTMKGEYRVRIFYVLMMTLIMLSTCTPHAMAGVVKYVDLRKPGGPDLPYGETIAIIGNVSDIEIDSESLGDWMAITSLTAAYKVDAGNEKTVQGRVDKESGKWEIVIEPLPISAFVSISMSVDGKLSGKAADRLITQLFENNAFDKAVDDFFAKATGTPSISDEMFLGFFKNIKSLAEKNPSINSKNHKRCRYGTGHPIKQ